MPELGKATVVVRLDTKHFHRDLKKAEKEFDKSTKQMDKDSKLLGKSIASQIAPVRKLGAEFKRTFGDGVKAMRLARGEYAQHGAALARLNPAVKRLGLGQRELTQRAVALRTGLMLASTGAQILRKSISGLANTVGSLAGDAMSSLASAVGKASMKMGAMAVVIGLVIVAIGPLILLVTGLAASLGAAALAAGALAVAFGATLLPAIFTAVAVMQKFKEESKKAGTEAFKLKRAAAGFGKEMKKAFGPAANAVMSGLSQGINALRGTFTKLSGPIHKVGQAMGIAFADLGRFLASAPMTRLFAIISNASARIIPVMNRGFERLLEIFGHIARAAMPLLESGLKGVVQWLGKVAGHTSNISKLRETIRTLAGHFKSWWNLLKSIGGALVAVFGATKEGSKGLVDSLTETINQFTAWAKTVEGKKSLRKTFDDAADAVRAIGTALVGITKFGTDIFDFFASGSDQAKIMQVAVSGIAAAIAGLILGLSAPVTAIVALGAALVTCYLKFETFRHTINSGMLAVAGVVVKSVDLIIGALTQLMGAMSSTLSAMSGIPGMGWAKDAANTIDDARDAMDGFRSSMRTTVADLKKQEAIRHVKALASQVDALNSSGKDSSKKMADLRQAILKLPKERRDEWLQALARSADGAKTPIAQLADQIAKSARTEKVSRLVAEVERLRKAGRDTGPAFEKAKRAIEALPEKERSQWVKNLNTAAGRAATLIRQIGTAIGNLTDKTVTVNVQRRETVFKTTKNPGAGQYRGGPLAPVPGFATGGVTSGGFVGRPTFMVGEQAPSHPEWVIATNPSYRKDNLGYWAQAGKALGVPGFQEGGTPWRPGRTKAPKYSDTALRTAAGDKSPYPVPSEVGQVQSLVGYLAEHWVRFGNMRDDFGLSEEKYFTQKEKDGPFELDQSAVNTRKGELETLKAYLTDNIKVTIDEIRTTMEKAVDALKKGIETIQGKIALIVKPINQRLDANRKDEAAIKKLNTGIGDRGERIKELRAQQSKKKTPARAKRISQLEKEQAGDRKRVGEIKGNISKRNTKIGDLRGRLSTLESARADFISQRDGLIASHDTYTAPDSVPAAAREYNGTVRDVDTELTSLDPDGVARMTAEMAEQSGSLGGGGGAGSDPLKDLIIEQQRNMIRDFQIGAMQAPVFKQFLGAFETGTPYIPRDGMAMLHEGEAVIPRSLNPYANGGAAGAPTVSIALSGSMNALDPHIEAVVDGKKAEIVKSTNEALGRTIRQSLQVPGGRY